VIVKAPVGCDAMAIASLFAKMSESHPESDDSIACADRGYYKSGVYSSVKDLEKKTWKPSEW
jgi:hypothetical protein